MEELNLYTKDTNTGKYEKAYIAEDRNYTLFSKLAEVRGCEDQISCAHSGFVKGCPEYIINEYEEETGFFGAHWFRWDELRLCAKYEGMTKYQDEPKDNWNVVQQWIDELWVILHAYWIFDTTEIYVQIYFDN